MLPRSQPPGEVGPFSRRGARSWAAPGNARKEAASLERDPLTLVGAGTLATSLGLLVARADWPLVGITSRTHPRALEATLLLGCPAFPDPSEPVSRSRFVLLAVPEGDLPLAFRRLLPALQAGTVVAHTGVAGPEILDGAGLPLALRPVGFVPPPQSGETTLLGCPVLLAGPPEACARGAALVQALGGVPLVVDGRPRLLALAAAELARRGRRADAARLWEEAGLGPRRDLLERLGAPAGAIGELRGEASRDGLQPLGEGEAAPPCEGPASTLGRLLREVDPAAARLLEEPS